MFYRGARSANDLVALDIYGKGKYGHSGMVSVWAICDAAEMAEIAALNQNKRYYTGIPQMLKSYVEMLLPVYKQK